MKKLIMIAGPGGVGKTTVCQKLFRMIEGSAWLDGDWCWMVNPYPGKTEKQKTYATISFGRILDGYMADPNTHTILFSWLIQYDFMFDLVTDAMAEKDYTLIKIVLTCDDMEVYMRRRLDSGRVDDPAAPPFNMERFHGLDAINIDVSHITADQLAERILGIID